jgi:aspartokinase/homoserine dehydrogenase 1
MQAGLIEPLCIDESYSVISVVGDRMRQHPGVSGRVFSALGSNGVNVVAIAQGSSERNISAVISQSDEVKALNAVHGEFFTGRNKAVNLWIFGTGGIGKTLLSLLAEHAEELRLSTGLAIALRGVANRRKMKLLSSSHQKAIPFEYNLQEDAAALPYSTQAFVEDCLRANAPTSIVVDCTASDEVPLCYPRLLERSVPVVTPNKRGFSSSLEFYDLLRASADSRRTPLLHETCVGAALPVLGTLQDLVRSGDTVLSIQAVLSGTLSYIFSSLNTGTPFSQAVREARSLGYTEPDPRDDLSGMDVARKVLILARDAGLRLEFDDIAINPILPPEACSGTIEEFMNSLPSLDANFRDLISDAKHRNARMYFAAYIDCSQGTASIGLREVSQDHPFWSLSGTDNIVAFTTQRYRTNPLVIKGPGAGPEVTAAGVFADIIRAAR